MAEAFDPYHKWLGIGPEERPANHYRLLAIREFESDPDVIDSAADRQMSHVRSFQTGAHSADSQRLLNELSAARLCLLTPAKKAAYDEQLRRLLAALSAGDVVQPRPENVPPPPPPPAIGDKTEVLSDIVASSPGRWHQPVVAKAQSWQGPLIAGLVTTAIILGLWVLYRVVSQEATSDDAAKQASARESSKDRQEDARQAEAVKQEKPHRPETAPKPVQPRQPPTPGDRQPVVASVLPANPWVELLSGVNVHRARIDGDWQRVRGGIAMGRRWGTSRLQVPAGMTGGYEADLVFRQTDGEDSVLWIFPVGTTHCTFYLVDSSKDDYAKSGLGDIQGRGASNNGTGFRAKFERDRDYTLRLLVRPFAAKSSIQVFLDRDRVVNWEGPQSALSTQDEWTIPQSGAFGLAGSDVAVTFKSLRVRKRPGREAVPSAPAPVASSDLLLPQSADNVVPPSPASTDLAPPWPPDHVARPSPASSDHASPRPADHVAPPRPENHAWKAKAEQFARDHLARWFDSEPFTDGKAKIPLDSLPPAPATSTWFLGIGSIRMENGAYPFGEDFEKGAPEVRYEIPALAADLHLKSVFVVLHQQGDVLQLAVGGVAADLPGRSAAEKKARVAELEQRINTLMAKRRTGRTADDSDVDDEETSKVDQELQKAREELENVKNESRESVSTARRENEQRLAALKQRCRSINVLIYQPVPRHGP